MNNETEGRLRIPNIAEKFGLLLDRYRRPDGAKWNGQELQDATGGVVTRSYVSMLRKGQITNPGFDKLRAIAKVMDFPPEMWFKELKDREEPLPQVREDKGISERLERLFKVVVDDGTGRPYTNADLARMSLGDITEEEVEAIRTGRTQNPSVAQILALSDVFGVHSSYFLDKEDKVPLLDRETMQALSDQKSRAIANKSLDLSEGEKDLIIDMIERLGYLSDGNRPA